MSDTPRTDREAYVTKECDIGFPVVNPALTRELEREAARLRIYAGKLEQVLRAIRKQDIEDGTPAARLIDEALVGVDRTGTPPAWLEEGRRLMHAARSAQGPAVEHYRSAFETWVWQHTVELLQLDGVDQSGTPT